MKSVNNLLEIKNLKVSIEENIILKNLNLKVKKGEIHAIMGPNGSGKSTFSKIVAGHPAYSILNGDILFKGSSIIKLNPSIHILERFQLRISIYFLLFIVILYKIYFYVSHC